MSHSLCLLVTYQLLPKLEPRRRNLQKLCIFQYSQLYLREGSIRVRRNPTGDGSGGELVQQSGEPGGPRDTRTLLLLLFYHATPSQCRFLSNIPISHGTLNPNSDLFLNLNLNHFRLDPNGFVSCEDRFIL